MEIIDIHSKKQGKKLSNFYPHKFVIDGIECNSMEGFLQSLKYKNPQKQAKICTLVGRKAKEKGKIKLWWRISGNIHWQGKRIKRVGKDFDLLIEKAYNCLFENEDFKKALLETKGKILCHTIGKHNKRATILTEEEFISNLNRLRNE
ncbi:MAG: hypothetical protein IJ400_00800 [Clostridia bacterium]|nr:hypothetical protein [Clostridia bacterium]